MPWSVEDVESHKKGLSDKGKKQWCRIANSVLKRCMEKGDDEKTCAASAIKQANGVVQANSGAYSVYKTKQKLAYEPKLAVHQEKAHLIVPVVMMVEGVHNGSQGPLLHTIDELGKFPESWNGIPVVIYHPEEDGQSVSANSPEIIDKMTVGRVYNTQVEGKKLKAEVWLDEDKLNTISEKTLNDVNDTKEVEISLGMFTENEMEEGEYEGEKYAGIAHNHRPDHLALLPDQIGACSCADGCGLGANKNNNMEIKTFIDGEKLTALLKSANDKAFSIHMIGNNADQGYQEKMQMVNDALRKLDKNKDGEYTYNYLQEMYDDYLIYTVNKEGESKMYKQDYEINSGGVELTGNRVEVHRKVEYVVNSGLTRMNNNNNNKGGQKMANAKDCPKCLEKINTLIANKDSKFEEADRDWLLTQEETVLDKLIPVIKEVEKTIEKTVEVNNLSDEDKAALAFGKKQLKERKEKMIKGIQDNTEKGVWDDATLNAMGEDILEKVYNSVKKEEKASVYIGEIPFNANTSKVEPLYPAGVEIKK